MSPSTLLFSAAVLCVLSLASGAAVIESRRYLTSTTGCTGEATVQVSYTAGQCYNSGDVSSAYYCSASGDKAYLIQYATQNCTAAAATSVTEKPTSCGFTTAVNYQLACVNATQGPALPSSFPFPSGWATSSACVNVTNNYQVSSTCSANGNANIHCTNSATNTGYCYKNGNSVSEMSRKSACSADGASVGTAYYSDASCATLVRVEQSPLQCSYGSITTSCGDVSLTNTLTKGIKKYDSDTCSGSVKSTTYFADSVCANSHKFTCFTNENGTYAQDTKFAGADGACTGDFSKDVQVDGACVSAKAFFCTVPTPAGGSTGGNQPGSAAAAGVSFFAVAIAAVLAVFAQRQ